MTSVSEESPRKSPCTRAMVARSTRTKWIAEAGKFAGSGRGSNGSDALSRRRSGRTRTAISLCWFDNRTRTGFLLFRVGDAGVHHVFQRDGHRLRRRANFVHREVTFIELAGGDLVFDNLVAQV